MIKNAGRVAKTTVSPLIILDFLNGGIHLWFAGGFPEAIPATII